MMGMPDNDNRDESEIVHSNVKSNILLVSGKGLLYSVNIYDRFGNKQC